MLNRAVRLVTFQDADRAAVGVVVGDEVVHLGAVDPRVPGSLRTLLAAGSEALAAAARAGAAAPASARRPLSVLRFLPLVPDPGKVLCLGRNYAEHAAEGGVSPPLHPDVFARFASSLIGHGEPLVRPRTSEKLDYEAELAVVIARRGRHIPEDQALAWVAGYSCFNDASVRDVQRRTSQWTLGKNHDATGALGPWLVTADELPPGAAGLRIQARLDGRVMQDASTADMVFGVARTVALLSACLTLEPGDVIATGTPAGVGFARTPPVWLAAGNVVEVEIEGVGVLRNPVVDED